MPMTTTDTTATVAERYLAAWNATDPAERRAALEATWTPECRFTDPMADTTGYDELAAFMGGVDAQFAGHRFVLSSDVDTHHDLVRLTWDLVGPDGTVAAVGHDTLTLAADGRIAVVTGFFGPLERVAA